MMNIQGSFSDTNKATYAAFFLWKFQKGLSVLCDLKDENIWEENICFWLSKFRS